jgi:hypothetical protein
MPDSPEDRPRFFSDISDALGADEICNAGMLAMVMARLPADTPIVLADTARIDPRLREDDDRRTAVVVRVVPIEAEIAHDTDLSDEERAYPAYQPAIQLGTVVIGKTASGTPHLTVPLPAQQRAEEAVIEGDLERALAAFTELLAWMARTLTASPDSDLGYGSAHLNRIEDANLRATIDGEAEQLDRISQSVSALRARVAEYEAVADLIEAAEEIIRLAADRPTSDQPEDDDRP